MRTLKCLLVLIFVFSSLSFVSSVWSQETSIPIIGGKGLIFESGIITNINENIITIKDDISKISIITEIDRSKPITQNVISQFKVGSRVKISGGKISTLPLPISRPIQPKPIQPK